MQKLAKTHGMAILFGLSVFLSASAQGPGGGNYAVQYNSGGSFAGTAFTGIPYVSTGAIPRTATGSDILGYISPGNSIPFLSTNSSGAFAAASYTPLNVAGGAMTGPLTGPEINGVYSVANAPSTCTVNSVAYTTQADCAFYAALYAASSTGMFQQVAVEPGLWNTCAGWAYGSTYLGGPAVQIKGAGKGVSTLQQSCANSNATIYAANP